MQKMPASRWFATIRATTIGTISKTKAHKPRGRAHEQCQARKIEPKYEIGLNWCQQIQNTKYIRIWQQNTFSRCMMYIKSSHIYEFKRPRSGRGRNLAPYWQWSPHSRRRLTCNGRGCEKGVCTTENPHDPHFDINKPPGTNRIAFDFAAIVQISQVNKIDKPYLLILKRGYFNIQNSVWQTLVR